MAVAVAEKPQSETSKKATHTLLEGVHELVVFCPKCKTLETLSFSDGHLMETRKFSQTDGRVYHDCGSAEPCRLYHGCVAKRKLASWNNCE